MRLTCLAATLLYVAAPAFAQDRNPCATGMVCASDPGSIVAAMGRANLPARLQKDAQGDPMIASAGGSSYHFDVYFYGCEKARNCDSLRFEVTFDKDPSATMALANKWNAGKRFIQASFKPDGRFAMAYDVPTIGGVNQRNFADILDWWSSMLGEAGDFFTAEIAVKK